MDFFNDKTRRLQECSPYYLEELASSYRYSEAILAAVELQVFSCLEPEGKTAEELADELGMDANAAARFLHVLETLGLVCFWQGNYSNSKISRRYLVQGNEEYQGDALLWHRGQQDRWRELAAGLKGSRKAAAILDSPQRMGAYAVSLDAMSRVRAGELTEFFREAIPAGRILDIGSGAGAVSRVFLQEFPQLVQTVLLDRDTVLEKAQELYGENERVAMHPADITDEWPVSDNDFSLVIVSMLLHILGPEDVRKLLAQAAACLALDGYLLIQDLFFEHAEDRSALFALNMLLRSGKGRVYSGSEVRDMLREAGLAVTELLPLSGDSAVLIAARNREALSRLNLDKKTQTAAALRRLGFANVGVLSVDRIKLSEWVPMKCEYGCSSFGEHRCPPNSPAPFRTRELLRDYSYCFLLEGGPPTHSFQLQVLAAEREVFLAGYHKAFAMWAGPCSICPDCSKKEGRCKNSKNSRPSMESSGIDVFETVRNAGSDLHTLREGDEWVRYFAVILAE